jgi:hypothetical protein
MENEKIMTPELLWNICELILTILFFAFGFYFLSKYMKEKDNDVKSVNLMNIAYAMFFWGTGVNQFLYLVDNIPEIWPTVYNFIGTGGFEIYLFTDDLPIDINTQVVVLVLVTFLSTLGLVYAQDKYIKGNDKVPVFKLILLTEIFIIIPEFVWYFIIGRINAPEGQILSYTSCVDCTENIFLLIINAIATFVLVILVWNIIVFYIIMAFKSPKGHMKTKSSLIAMGILLLYGGLFGGNLGSNFLEGYLNLLGPILFFIGLIILFIGFNKKIEY